MCHLPNVDPAIDRYMLQTIQMYGCIYLVISYIFQCFSTILEPLVVDCMLTCVERHSQRLYCTEVLHPLGCEEQYG